MHLYLATAEAMYTVLGTRLETIQSRDGWCERGRRSCWLPGAAALWSAQFELSRSLVCGHSCNEHVSSIFHNLTISTAAAAVEHIIQKDTMWKMRLLVFSLAAMPLKKTPQMRIFSKTSVLVSK